MQNRRKTKNEEEEEIKTDIDANVGTVTRHTRLNSAVGV